MRQQQLLVYMTGVTGACVRLRTGVTIGDCLTRGVAWSWWLGTLPLLFGKQPTGKHMGCTVMRKKNKRF